MTEPKIDEATGVPTMGHEWDGIQELDNPMPRWWLWTFYATIVFAIGYCIAYPAIPLLERATAGTLGWTSRGQLADETAKAQAARASTLAALAKVDIATLDARSPLMQAAVEGGRAAFKINCAACHGAGAAGTKGYPNLNDDDWLWGGSRVEIHQTLVHGIRQPGDDATRMSQMPAFGRDGILKPDEVQDVVSYVRAVSHQDSVGASARRGAALFAANCAMCHGADAKGGRQFGAPNLTDAIWLYGGDRESLIATVVNARNGVMPAWGKTLDAATINMLTAYVHALGGGE
ncbi:MULTISPECIES: cytochrome-c oxidase, cbb3-type subunit III [unclassified Sphingomonas]|uniref:cytochrome-c oxidase, cbb3-type subunit III n=1 Tax=unclassified Sphingomonas TaxID=196159 RepID=UPI0006F4E9B7|nr:MULTISPECIES: cytochrome-c oxidase, cbb3-type subunit III [unclassified Sphingomonas]KQX23275.1 cytochrome C oxidase Cbb3 [Sphingomonas sp. Root1294]KQY68123.1 cytochrome C oxidase Cbb3 [Sphingomonas sp. Root50]KRB91015.1 cytochrome C oxidase Cbb3 [Sphingomonas sp. Root720]